MKEKIFVFGASGHAKVVIDIIERQQCCDIAFLVDDDPALKDTEFFGYHVIGGKQALLEARDRVGGGIVAVGSNRARSSVASWITANNFTLVSAVHPSAQIGRGTSIGVGTVVMAGAVVNADVCIGRNVIINSRASIDHDCRIGDAVHVAPGSTLCGTVAVGTGTFVCAGVTIIPNLTIGSNVTIGAGSTVKEDVPDGVTVAGSPAKVLTRLQGAGF